MNITKAKLKELISELSSGENDDLYDTWNDFLYGGEFEYKDYTFKHIFRDRVNSDTWVVFQIGDELWRLDGWYASYEGSNFEDAEPYKVIPKEVTVIQYVKAPRQPKTE
jgi:hypothetical protein